MAVEPTLPTPVVIVGGVDLTDDYDHTSLRRFSGERGEGQASFNLLLASENEALPAGIVRDADVVITTEGEDDWIGHVVAIGQPQPDLPVVAITCAGEWDRLHQNQAYCKVFRETRYDNVRLLAPNADSLFSLDTQGQILVTLPYGNAVKAGKGIKAYIWVLDGLDDDLTITGVSFDLTTGGAGYLAYMVTVVTYPFAGGPVLYSEIAASGQASPGSLHVAFNPATPSRGYKVLQVYVYAAMDVPGTTTQDEFVQIRNLAINCTGVAGTALDVGATAYMLYYDATGDGSGSHETIAPTLVQNTYDPFTTPADAIQAVLARAAVPPLCGVLGGKFYCLNRPTSPPDTSRLWVVSYELTPGLQWQVQVDETQDHDYVCVAYETAGDTAIPAGMPAKTYYPSTPPANTSRVALINTGTQLTSAEAQATAQQAYAFYHGFVQGSITVPYVVHNGYLQGGIPVDHIQPWDWVLNVGKLDPDEAGPFLVSEVEKNADGIGTIATLTIGTSDGYSFESPYRLPTQGRYVGAHTETVSYKKKVSFATYWHHKYAAYYKKHHRYPKMPAHHRKYGFIPATKTVDVAGTYV